MDAHDDYWGGRPPIRTLRLMEVPETSACINGLLTGQYQFACDFPPDVAKAKDLLKQTSYKGDSIPYPLLNDDYTNQVATAQVLVEMWRQAGPSVDIGMKENWTQIYERGPTRAVRDWSNSAPFNDPVSSIVSRHGPNGEQQQHGEWTNAEMNRLSLPEPSAMPLGCAFAPRCERHLPACDAAVPPPDAVAHGHRPACIRAAA